jgi:hypothetical protein
MFVDHTYPWTDVLIPQQRVGFQESTYRIFVSQETCLPTRSLAMDLHVTIGNLKSSIFWDITPCYPLKATNVSDKYVVSFFMVEE